MRIPAENGDAIHAEVSLGVITDGKDDLGNNDFLSGTALAAGFRPTPAGRADPLTEPVASAIPLT